MSKVAKSSGALLPRLFTGAAPVSLLVAAPSDALDAYERAPLILPAPFEPVRESAIGIIAATY